MADRPKAVTMKGNPLTLTGDEISVGDAAPDVELMGIDLQPKKISDYRGKVVILSTIPSIDTGTCNTQTHRFNQEASALSDDIAIVTVSMDLPFAQKRWCGDAGDVKIDFLSDFKTHEFGHKYGLRVKELGVLARSVSVIDGDGKIVYRQIVDEIADEPNYDEPLAAAKTAL